MAESELSDAIVCLAVASWGIAYEHEALARTRNGSVYDYVHRTPHKGSGLRACLNRHHTHYLLVDDGTEGHFGGEIVRRARARRRPQSSRRSLSRQACRRMGC